VYDLAKDRAKPQAVLTGDTLFVGAVGRPDLMASVGVSAEELARMLYRSLREKLLALPDETVVYPGHGPGSACGKGMSSETTSTIGAQRRTNPALQPMDEAAFVRLMTTDLPSAPAYFGFDAELNKKERRTLDTVLAESLRPLALDEAERQVASGALVLDTRDADSFARGHWKGAVHIGLTGQYASWAGTLLDPATPLVIVAEPGKEHESAMRLGRIGFDRVAGFLDGGYAALAARPELVARDGRLDPPGLRRRLDAPRAPLVVDVRTPDEWSAGHIDGALHVPLNRLPAELERVPRDRELVCVCKGGYRSSIAKSLLERAGYEPLSDLRGGMDAWKAAVGVA
jgi:rhodanese-related sulfurtransferase